MEIIPWFYSVNILLEEWPESKMLKIAPLLSVTKMKT